MLLGLMTPPGGTETETVLPGEPSSSNSSSTTRTTLLCSPPQLSGHLRSLLLQCVASALRSDVSVVYVSTKPLERPLGTKPVRGMQDFRTIDVSSAHLLLPLLKGC